MSDITIRALEVLKKSDIILCEDTRITSRLLRKYDIFDKKLISYNDNSDEKIRKNILQKLLLGNQISLVSDAGTPLISDPGHKLIELIKENNIKITTIPGACSAIAALTISGLKIDNFAFLGFAPSSKKQRQDFLKNAPRNISFVYFESPNRLLESLFDIKNILNNRKICVAREITKIHEESITNNIDEIIKFFENNQSKIRGEFVIIVEKEEKICEINEEDLIIEIKKMLEKGYSLKDISKNLSDIYDINKKKIYQLALSQT